MIRDVLKKDLNFSYRKLGVRHTFKPDSETLNLQKKFLIVLGAFIIQNFEIIFVDEFSMNWKTYRSYSWATRGQDAYLFLGPSNFWMNGMIAVSQNQMVGLHLYEENTESKNYSDFIIQLHENFWHSNEEQNRDVVFVFDNARYHIS